MQEEMLKQSILTVIVLPDLFFLSFVNSIVHSMTAEKLSMLFHFIKLVESWGQRKNLLEFGADLDHFV